MGLWNLRWAFAPDDRKKGVNGAVNRERNSRSLACSLTDEKDVISKNHFEQHLFTSGAKY
jgi:hypothetical protein